MRRTLVFCLVALSIICAAQTPCSAARLTVAGGGRQADDVKKTELEEAARLGQEVVKLFAERKYSDALPLAERSLALKEKHLGADNPALSTSLYNLAALYQATNKPDKAEPLFVRALALYEKVPGVDTQATENALSSLGVMYYRRGKYEPAVANLERAVALREKRLGAEHAELAPMLANLGEAYVAVRKLDQAVRTLQRAIDIWTKDALAHTQEIERAHDRIACLSAFGGHLPPIVRPDLPAGSGRVIDFGVINGKAISKPQPAYPLAAKQARAQGPVVVKILVDEQGRVVKAESICGHQLLTAAAEDAAREARFTPTLFQGQPVKVSGYITYNFLLR